MRHLFSQLPFALSLPLAILMMFTASAAESISLMGTIVKWRYPDAEVTKSQMQDAATVAADGTRTVPSMVLSTTMSMFGDN